MSWEKQRNPVQQSGVWSPDASLHLADLPCSELLLNQAGANRDLGGLPTDPSHVTRRKKECTLDLK